MPNERPTPEWYKRYLECVDPAKLAEWYTNPSTRQREAQDAYTYLRAVESQNPQRPH